jgi:hypothetical protein
MRTRYPSSTEGRAAGVLVASLIAGLSACSNTTDTTNANADVSIAYVKRPVAAIGNPTDSITNNGTGGDLYIRDKSSPSATETNVTGAYTNGHGDVSDPEVSYDGTKLLFAMRCETGASTNCLNPDGTGNDTNWRVWEYDLRQKTFTRIRCDASAPGDDVDPAYLPDGRIVFVSNRQEASRRHLEEEHPGDSNFPYAYLDEYERETTTALHVMNADGSQCHQISFNQSHDRNPTVLLNGEIMYSRWDHVGERNQFTIFKTNPDGTNLFVKYGAHSGVVSFLHPREMPNGQVISDAMPLSRTHEGGALMAIDIEHYSENCVPIPGGPAGCNGQSQPTPHEITVGSDISQYGRFSNPYPLWDGSGRVLVSWTPSCTVTDSCQMVVNPVTNVAEPSEEDTPPVYGVYMLDPGQNRVDPVVTAPPGYAVLNPVAIQPRPKPVVVEDRVLQGDEVTLANKTSQIGTKGMGVLDVASVYDTDSQQDRMGDGVLTQYAVDVDPTPDSTHNGVLDGHANGMGMPSNDLKGECIPRIGYSDRCASKTSGNAAGALPDLMRLKNPAQTRAAERPARFIRVTRAIPTEGGISRQAIGETDFEMQQILGYVPIEPDGSFNVQVPADIPIALTVVDAVGRGFTQHTNWIQVRPGETRGCNGCHSPRRGNAINASPITDSHPNTLWEVSGGKTMARTHLDHDSAANELKAHLVYEDVWTDPAKAGRPADASYTIDYTGAPAAPVNGVIDYKTHIAPIWTKARTFPDGSDGTCTTCHYDSDPNNATTAGLDLRDSDAGTGRVISYEELLVGDPVLQADANGVLRPVITFDDGEAQIQRREAQVIPGAARGSHLIEVLFNQELGSAYALGPTDHSSLLSAAEKRLASEWADVGGQYYNSPRDSSGTKRGVTGLSLDDFQSTVFPILQARCAGCHQAVGLTGSPAGANNAGFRARRYVLTGQPEGDYNVTLSMIGDVTDPANTELLRRPTSDGINPPHGVTAAGGPILTTGEADYGAICRWINSTAGVCP